MQRAYVLLLALALLSRLGHAQDFSGSYAGNNNGVPISLTLRQSGSAIQGVAQASGQQFPLSATVQGTTARGTLGDPQAGSTLEVELSLQGDALTLVLLVPDQNTGQLQQLPISLQRGAASPSGSSAPAVGSTGGTHDPQLVGLWAYQEVMTGGGIGVATQLFMEFRPDGTALQGNARTVGGGPNWSGDTGHSGETEQFLWRTENDVIFGTVPGSNQWVPVARYYIEGNRMLLTYGNGNREIWYRQ